MHQIDTGIKENFFQWKGRLNRKRYLNRTIVIFLAGLAIYILMALLALLVGGDPVHPDETAAMGVVGFFTLLRIPLTIASFMLMIRRLHDVGLSGYFCLAAFIPFVNLGLILYLLFKQGTVGDNAYGPDPLGSAVGTAAPDTPQRPENPYARATYGDAPTDIAPPHDQKD